MADIFKHPLPREVSHPWSALLYIHIWLMIAVKLNLRLGQNWEMHRNRARLISPPLRCEHFVRTFCFMDAQQKILGQFWKRETIKMAYKGHLHVYTDHLSISVDDTDIPWKISPPLRENLGVLVFWHKKLIFSNIWNLECCALVYIFKTCIWGGLRSHNSKKLKMKP